MTPFYEWMERVGGDMAGGGVCVGGFGGEQGGGSWTLEL